MDLTTERVENILAKTIPLIEKTGGRKYKSIPEYRIIPRRELRRIIIAEELPGLKTNMKGMDEDQIRRQAEYSAQLRSQLYVARYINQENILYVIPENVKAMKERYEVKDEDLNGFIVMVIAHELVHALDNQHYDLIKILGQCENTDEISAFGAVIDGSAAWVTRRIADKMGISEAAHKNSLKASLGIRDETTGAGKENFNLYFVMGEKFIARVTGKNGQAGFDKAFMSPPKSVRHILFPDEFLSPSTRRVTDCTKLIKKLADRLPARGMQSQTKTLTTVDLRTLLTSQGIKKKEAVSIADNCLNGAMHMAIKQAVTPGIISVMLFDFKDRDTAASYDDFTMKVLESQKAQIKAGLNTSYNIVKQEEVKQEGFDLVRYMHIDTSVDNKTTSTMSIVGIADGFYVGIDFINIKDISEQDMLEILDLVREEKEKLNLAQL